MIALDPLLEGRLLWTPLLIVILKVIVVFVVGLVSTIFMVNFERKMVSGLQNRIGPNKAGPRGILQALADGIKAFFKEDLLPSRADRIVFRLAPFLSFVPAFLIWSVIPLGGDFGPNDDGTVKDGTVEWFGEVTRVQLADPPMGILVVLALSSIAVYGIMLAGWSSGSKYPLLGSVRASAQMVSYEAALGLSLAAVLLSSGTLSTAGTVAQQDSLADWNVFATGIAPFVIFLIATTAELNRPPFDLVEAEQELVGGFNTEYSGIRFALFFLAEYMGVVTMSAVIVTLFLGGPQPLFIGDLDILGFLGPFSGTAWFALKLLCFLYLFVWFRATLPRLRYDQLMDFGWKILIPIALGWFLLLAALREFSPDGAIVDGLRIVLISLAVGVVAGGLFLLALRVARNNRMATEELPPTREGVKT
ncbi:MAG: NADH-quinone oxidoreductase subunit NuoH [Actinomycetota bacterium]